MGNENQMKEVFALQMSGKCIVEATQQMRLVQEFAKTFTLTQRIAIKRI